MYIVPKPCREINTIEKQININRVILVYCIYEMYEFKRLGWKNGDHGDLNFLGVSVPPLGHGAVHSQQQCKNVCTALDYNFLPEACR
jgi:hypothetical protein